MQMDTQELRQALRKMLQVELEAMQYYQQASRFMKDEGAIYHFNLLAQEELEHARTFHAVYPDTLLPSLDELIQNLPAQQRVLKVIDQELMARMTEQHALQLAMELEKAVAEKLQQLLKSVHSPAARAAIETNIESTLGHLELITQDYQRLFGIAQAD
jgi:rubrerythrin